MILINAELSKQDFLINLMKEFTFVKDIKIINETGKYEKAIKQSEKDFSEGNSFTQNELEKEISSWRK